MGVEGLGQLEQGPCFNPEAVPHLQTDISVHLSRIAPALQHASLDVKTPPVSWVTGEAHEL